MEKQEKLLGIRKADRQRICRSFITVSVREHFVCVRFKRDFIMAYRVLVQSGFFFFLFEIMILLLCKMSGLTNKSNVSGVTDHLDNPSFEVDENGKTKPVIFLAYFV